MDRELVRAQLQRILASSAFADAERGSRFLRFVVEATLEGRACEIKESIIGVEVFGRGPSFDPKIDPIRPRGGGPLACAAQFILRRRRKG